MDMPNKRGTEHPISILQREGYSVFSPISDLKIAAGPELETEWYKLRRAQRSRRYHPARDMQDTFWIKGERRQSAPHARDQRDRAHALEATQRKKTTFPLAFISIGKVFRNEA